MLRFSVFPFNFFLSTFDCFFQTFSHGLFAQHLKSVGNGKMAQKNFLFYEKYNGAVMLDTASDVPTFSLQTLRLCPFALSSLLFFTLLLAF